MTNDVISTSAYDYTTNKNVKLQMAMHDSPATAIT